MLVPVRYMNNYFEKDKADFSDICLEIVSSYCERCTKKEECKEYQKRKNGKGTT